MKRITPLALSLSFVFSAAPLVHAEDSGAFRQSIGVDEGLATGLDMMLLNSSLLRNGDNVWQRVREGFQLDEVNAELVRRHERSLAARPEYFSRILERSHKYLFHIMNEVERRGMPTEIALLPAVESAFVATAQSSVGASGLWQFMPSTGRHYGLEQTWWYDGRRDVTASTSAALDYLDYLHGLFGDWNLALAAYNWGEGNLTRAIARAQAAGLEPTYENLKLPNETRNYVPKLLAVRNLLASPDKFGLKLDKFPNKPYFVAVSTGRHMDLDVAAKMAGMSVSEFKELNPAFNLPVYAHKAGRQMLIPANRVDKFEANLNKWDKPLLSWQVYTPATDEDVAAVADRYGMSPAQLQAVNRVKGSTISAGKPLLVALKGNADLNSTTTDTDSGSDTTLAGTLPAATLVASASPAVMVSNTPSGIVQPVALTVRTTTTATPVAPPPAAAMPENTGAARSAGPAPQSSNPASKPSESGVAANVATPNSPPPVKAGEVSVAGSAAAPSSTAVVKVNEVSVASNKANETSAVVASSAAPVVTSTHIVASGDTLFNIARRYNLTVSDLKAFNGLADNGIRLGQTLQLKAPAGSGYLASASRDSLMRVAATTTAATGAVPAEYVVQRGDTMFSIARKFGVRHSDLQRWNGSDEVVSLQPGQRVRLQGL
ncbi:membrane-bound lytic murein transglycosylase D [Pseudogulbenkiania subflava DSM 22618]|uniref:Membrane-bound lytic murein transglycosylase D n=1 Tax=Pseudogulbenkiania subflava DSM 22618 TaxID=1123014 RepID=A0A1Y6BPQ5_9NEIS|nr:membrane-bound lytic murein transglycosylase D [Pseudogulbenkiania subflava DSM 22618]